MKTKTVSIPLPLIEGIELKNATVDLKKGVVVAEYGEEEVPFEAKKGDFLTLKTDPSKVVIFEAMAGVFGGVETFTIIYDLPTYIEGEPVFTIEGVRMSISSVRYSTEGEKALMIEEMEKLGKRYNPETFKVEDIEKDISEIVTDENSARDYLGLTPFEGLFYEKSYALTQLMTIAKAWNAFDEFKPDWANREQEKHYPRFEFKNGKFEFSYAGFARFSSDTHASIFSFKTPERAEQFGKQFIDLFRIVLTN